MSDPKKIEPDDELLEFLGGIDEVNDEDQEDDFSDFLANTDIDKLADAAQQKPLPDSAKNAPVKDAKHE